MQYGIDLAGDYPSGMRDLVEGPTRGWGRVGHGPDHLAHLHSVAFPLPSRPDWCTRTQSTIVALGSTRHRRIRRKEEPSTGGESP